MANQTLIARWMKAVIIIERKEIAPIMTVTAAPARLHSLRAPSVGAVRCLYVRDRPHIMKTLHANRDVVLLRFYGVVK